MKIAIYAGSFDVFHNGHKWVVDSALTIFDKVIVAVAMNPEKSYSLSDEERLNGILNLYGDVPGIEVISVGNDFIGDVAKEHDAKFLIRGVRNPNDFEFERQIQNINLDFFPELQTIFLAPPKYLVDISSTMIKKLLPLRGWQEKIKNYVPLSTQKLLMEKYK